MQIYSNCTKWTINKIIIYHIKKGLKQHIVPINGVKKLDQTTCKKKIYDMVTFKKISLAQCFRGRHWTSLMKCLQNFFFVKVV